MQILREFCVATLAKFPRKITQGEIHSCVHKKKLQPLRFFPDLRLELVHLVTATMSVIAAIPAESIR